MPLSHSLKGQNNREMELLSAIRCRNNILNEIKQGILFMSNSNDIRKKTLDEKQQGGYAYICSYAHSLTRVSWTLKQASSCTLQET